LVSCRTREMKRRYRDLRTGGLATVKPSVVYSGFDLDQISVNIRGHGGATRIMKKILNDADSEIETLYLVVVPSGPMNEIQLRTWYQKLGFEEYGPLRMRRIPSAARRPSKY
jgi:N-acetylglutamate synthase-like GNAT family acetyltransferase